MEVLQTETPFIDSYFADGLPAPDELRGLSLREVSRQYSTPGLYLRLQGSLAANCLDSPAIQTAIELGLTVHGDQMRTYQPYGDHLLEVTGIMVEDYGIRDEATVAAGPTHDCIEDHPRETVQYFGGNWIEDELEAREAGREAIAKYILPETAEIVWVLTNPPRPPGTTRAEANRLYANRQRQIVLPQPKPRAVKHADFDTNNNDNYLTRDPKKQRHMDIKNQALYDDHEYWLLQDDSLVVGKYRDYALERLRGGRARSLARSAAILGQLTVRRV